MAENEPIRDRETDDDRDFDARAEEEFSSPLPPAVTFPPEAVSPDAVDDPDRGEYIGAVRAGLTIVPEVTEVGGEADVGDAAADLPAASAAPPLEEEIEVVVEVDADVVAPEPTIESLEADSLGDQSYIEAPPPPDEPRIPGHGVQPPRPGDAGEDRVGH